MKRSIITETKDLDYKKGYVQCKCGWYKSLGDGFNGYHIEHCPNCTKELDTRIQETVTTGRPGNYTVRHGKFTYFVISNGCNIQYDAQIFHTEYKSRIPR